MTDHAGASPDGAADDPPSLGAARGIDGRSNVVDIDLDVARIVQEGVRAFGHDRDHPVVGVGRWRLVDEDPDGGVIDPPDGHRRGQEDGALEGAELVDLGATADLASAVEDRDPCLDRVAGEGLGITRQDGRHAGPRRATAGGRSRLIAPDGGVADAHAGDVDDGVRGSGRHQADDDPEIARAAPRRRRSAGP